MWARDDVKKDALSRAFEPDLKWGTKILHGASHALGRSIIC